VAANTARDPYAAPQWNSCDRAVRQSARMSNKSEHVTALIRELLMLNRIESAPTIEHPVGEDVGGRQAKRTRIRQELVQALDLHHRKKS
jgi:hypothetical protein